MRTVQTHRLWRRKMSSDQVPSQPSSSQCSSAPPFSLPSSSSHSENSLPLKSGTNSCFSPSVTHFSLIIVSVFPSPTFLCPLFLLDFYSHICVLGLLGSRSLMITVAVGLWVGNAGASSVLHRSSRLSPLICLV
ncbi:hypothetical protein MHYP_G00236140 [Metynnis hypsauchen]